MQMCKVCNEPVVFRSKVFDICLDCYEALDLGRFEEIILPDSPSESENATNLLEKINARQS